MSPPTIRRASSLSSVAQEVRGAIHSGVQLSPPPVCRLAHPSNLFQTARSKFYLAAAPASGTEGNGLLGAVMGTTCFETLLIQLAAMDLSYAFARLIVDPLPFLCIAHPIGVHFSILAAYPTGPNEDREETPYSSAAILSRR